MKRLVTALLVAGITVSSMTAVFAERDGYRHGSRQAIDC